VGCERRRRRCGHCEKRVERGVVNRVGRGRVGNSFRREPRENTERERDGRSDQKTVVRKGGEVRKKCVVRESKRLRKRERRGEEGERRDISACVKQRGPKGKEKEGERPLVFDLSFSLLLSMFTHNAFYRTRDKHLSRNTLKAMYDMESNGLWKSSKKV
jgi:hypothetical protein